VVAVDTNARRVRTEIGEDSYCALILATGGTAKALPGLPADNERVFSLRTYADACSITAALARADRVAVIGGGWLGLEIAAAAGTLGKNVTVFETAAALCPRSLPPAVGKHLQNMHENHGVRIVTHSRAAFAREASRIVARDADGAENFDIAVVAIGLAPQVALACDAGLACDDGILTDGAGRTSAPGVYAIGDVARFRHDGMREALRLESWTSAGIQGAVVAQAICGGRPQHTAAPWFWSEQYGHIIQVAGLPQAGLELMSEEAGDRPLWRYGRGSRISAVIGLDRARDVRAASASLSAQLADASRDQDHRTAADAVTSSTQAL
jgi:3-phenylpropionate/trans-cinnamate dioxygenase ferredoxin reductase subunit